MQKWSPFGRSLAVIMVGFTLIPMLILTGLGIINVRAQLHDHSLTQTATVAALIQQAISKWIGDARLQLTLITTQPDVAKNLYTLFAAPQGQSEGQSSIQADLNRAMFILATRYFTEFYAVTLDGRIVLSSQLDSQGKTLDIDLPTLTQSGKYTWGFRPLSLLGPHVALMWQPIRDQNRALVGFVVGQISLESLSSVIRNNTVGMGLSGETYLIDADNLSLTELRYPLPSVKPPQLLLKPSLTQYNVNGMFSGQFDDYAARPVIGIVQPLQVPLSASLVVHQQQAEAFASLNTFINAALILTICLMAVAILASLLISQRIIRPLQRLSAAAGSMAAGDFNTTVEIVRNDEIGVLAVAFNLMTSKLSLIFSELAQSNRILRLRAEQISAINRVGQQATEALDLNVLLETVAAAIQKTFKYDRVALYLPDPQTTQLVCHTMAVIGLPATDAPEPLPRYDLADTSFVGAAARSQQPVNIPDVRCDPRYVPNHPRSAVQSEICLPLLFGGHLLGVLDIQSARLNAFIQPDLEGLTILAHQLAIAIRNADLFRDKEIARKVADDANRQKSEFLSTMSHELRTPLNVIIGYSTSMLTRPVMYDNIPLPPVYDSAITGIMNSGQHLLGLINDILDLSKIEAGQVELSVEPIDPLSILEGIRATAIGLVKPEVRVRADYASDLPLVLGDDLRIRQTLLNLVSNAAKFTDHGTLTLSAAVRDDKLLFTVSDTGIGIPEDAKPFLFGRFRQASRDVERAHGGSGLGLNIARQLVLMQGGDIGFESREGHGAKFFFTIPLAPPGATLAPPAASTEQISSRVSIQPFDSAQSLPRQALLVDSGTQTRHALHNLLTRRNYDVLEADNPAVALELSELVSPALIVLHLHRKDSEDMLRLPVHLRELPALKNLPLIVFHNVRDFEEQLFFQQIEALELARQ